MIKLTIECRDVEHARACIDALNAHAPDVEKQTAAVDALVEAVDSIRAFILMNTGIECRDKRRAESITHIPTRLLDKLRQVLADYLAGK